MDSKQHLYYALGALAYSVAKADGKVQREEKEKVKQIVENSTTHSMDFGYTDIIFHLLQKDKAGFKEVYDWSMNSFELGKYHLTPEMVKEFVYIMNQVADAYPPSDLEEKALIARFESDIKKIQVKNPID